MLPSPNTDFSCGLFRISATKSRNLSHSATRAVHGDEPTTGSLGATGGAWICESHIHLGALICSVPQPGIRGGREHSKLTSRVTLSFNGEAHNERKAVGSCNRMAWIRR